MRIVRVGAAAALAAGLAGWALERARLGPSSETAMRRVEVELRQRFDASATTLGSIAARLAADPETARAGPRDQASVKRLFDVSASAVPPLEAGRTGVTIYDAAGEPIAWAGRVSDVPKDRILGRSTLLIAPSALGPRLIRIEPVTRDGARAATIVAEQSLGTLQAPGVADAFVLPTSLVPVTVRVRAQPGPGPGAPRPYTFVVPARDGGFALEAEVSPADLASTRAHGRDLTRAALLGVLAWGGLFLRDTRIRALLPLRH